MKLSVPGVVIDTYFANVRDRRSMRDIGLDCGANASTICRRVQRVEELRDGPEWGEILDAIEACQTAPDATPEPVTPDTVLAALGLTRGDVVDAFCAPRAPLSDTAALVTTATGLKLAVVTVAGDRIGTVPRAVVLAAFAFGWLRPALVATAKLRSFTLNSDAVRESLRALQAAEGVLGATDFPPASVHRRNPDLLDDALLDVARAFSMLWELRDGTARPQYARLRAQMPAPLFGVLEKVCGRRIGVESLEFDMGLPARSGKVLLSAALEVARHVAAADPELRG